ncbi:MAG: histidinol-phosphatase [Victivallales bacterium]|nr:histidinol-phosphatase [Victivallales bacterium]
MNSYHNHCNWSDGANDMRDMYRAAREAGFHEFGLSDHYVKAPFGDNEITSYSIDKTKLAEYVEACLACKKEFETDSFTIRLGMEVDFFPENAQDVAKELLQYPFDYLIGSVHFSNEFPIDHTAACWEALPPGGIDEIWHDYWTKIRLAAESGLYSFIGHLDLPKKFNFYPSYDYTDEALAALKAIKTANIVMEINTAGWAKPCKSAYPSRNILKTAHELGIPMIISSDAHDTRHLKRFFPEAEQCLQDAGYSVFTYAFQTMKRI